jgi:hypothetical protein
LKADFIEMGELIEKAKPTERFDCPIEPEGIALPLGGSNGFDTQGCNQSTRHGFETQTRFILNQITNLLSRFGLTLQPF